MERLSTVVRKVEGAAMNAAGEAKRAYKTVEVKAEELMSRANELYEKRNLTKVQFKRNGVVQNEFDFTDAAVVGGAGAFILSRLNPVVGVLSAFGLALSGYTITLVTREPEEPSNQA